MTSFSSLLNTGSFLFTSTEDTEINSGTDSVKQIGTGTSATSTQVAHLQKR